MFQANQTFQHQKQKLKRKKGEIGYQIEYLKCVQKIKEVEKQTKKEKKLTMATATKQKQTYQALKHSNFQVF